MGKKMENQKSNCKRRKSVIEYFRSITCIDLAFKATNVLEILMWVVIGISGVMWAGYFITHLATDKNPIIVTQIEAKLTDIKYPAMTICSKASTKYAIAERMGNYLNGNSKKLKHLLKIFAVAITFMSNQKNATIIYNDYSWPNYKCRSSNAAQACKVCT